LKVRGIDYIREREMCTLEAIVLEPGPFEVEVAIVKGNYLYGHALINFRQNWSKQEIHKRVN